MAKFLGHLLAVAEVEALLSSDHFSLDSTLLQVCVSYSSLERIDELYGDDDHPVVAMVHTSSVAKKQANGVFRVLRRSMRKRLGIGEGR